MKISNAIAEMDIDNLTDEQLLIISQLAFFAEDGYDLSSERAINTELRHYRNKQANRCMVLRNRLGREIKNRVQQEQNK